MQILYTSLFLCLFLTTLNGQIIWIKSYNFQGSTTSRELIQTQNGELLVGGYTFTTQSSGSRHLFLLKTNATNGDSLSLEKCTSGISCNDRSWIEHLFQRPNSNELYSVNETYYPPCAYLAKHNTGIGIEWGRPLCIDTIHYINEVQAFDDGFVLAGQFSLNDFVLQKRNYDGKIMWSRRIKVREIGMQPQLVALPEGKIVLLYRDGLNFGQTYLECFDKNGISLWRKATNSIFQVASNPRSPYIYTLEGVWSNFNTYMVKKYAVSAGQVVWESVRTERDFPTNALAIDSIGEVYIAGSLTIPDLTPLRTLFLLAKLDSNGKFLWSKYYDEPGFVYPQRMIITPQQDLFFLLAGDNSNGFKIMKMKREGLVSNINDVEQASQVQVFPNPTGDVFYISSQAKIGQRLDYQICTSNGQVMSNGIVENTDLKKVDASNFPKGIYFLIFTNEKGQKFARKIIKF